VDDGILGPETLDTLLRVGSKTNGQDVVAAIRERQRLRESPRTLHGRRVVVGETGGLSALADRTKRALSRAGAVVTTLHDPDGSVQAGQANALDGEVTWVLDSIRSTPDAQRRTSWATTGSALRAADDWLRRSRWRCPSG